MTEILGAFADAWRVKPGGSLFDDRSAPTGAGTALLLQYMSAMGDAAGAPLSANASHDPNATLPEADVSLSGFPTALRLQRLTRLSPPSGRLLPSLTLGPVNGRRCFAAFRPRTPHSAHRLKRKCPNADEKTAKVTSDTDSSALARNAHLADALGGRRC